MTLEGEYYVPCFARYYIFLTVAILMTLEGEYYAILLFTPFSNTGRNPHDIGRRILQEEIKVLKSMFPSRNPHDIGRRILLYDSKLAISQQAVSQSS